MLPKTSISNIIIHSDDWFAGRLARFTSSECHFLMDDNKIPAAGYNYIYRKVGEELTGLPCRREISTEDTEHGHLYEPDGIRAFGNKMGIEFLVTQRLIVPEGGREGSTPDGIWVRNESVDKTMYNVSTVEVKCPTSYDRYISFWNCKAPEDVKKASKAYYWQVLHQMRVCDAMRGYLVIYQPFFKTGNINIVEFRKPELVDDFKTMNNRIQDAETIFIAQRNKMIAA